MQVWSEPLITDRVKALRSLIFSRCLPVSVERSSLTVQATGPAVGVLLGFGVADSGLAAAGVELLGAPGLGVRVGVDEPASAVGPVGGGGEGSAWTADPLLVPLAIMAPATASTTIATPITAIRRTQ